MEFFGLTSMTFLNSSSAFVVLLLAFENGRPNQPGQFVIGGLNGKGFGLAGGRLGFGEAVAAFVNLRIAQVRFAIDGSPFRPTWSNLMASSGLLRFAEHHRQAVADGRVIGIFREGFLAGLHCFRQVAGLAIGVHDQQARATVFFVTQTASSWKV